MDGIKVDYISLGQQSLQFLTVENCFRNLLTCLDVLALHWLVAESPTFGRIYSRGDNFTPAENQWQSVARSITGKAAGLTSLDRGSYLNTVIVTSLEETVKDDERVCLAFRKMKRASSRRADC
jgi:hypothetical protein